MPYEFSLRALLRIRRIYEQRERMRLMLLNASRSRVRNEEAQVMSQRTEGFEGLELRLERGMDGSEFQLECAGLQRLADRQRELEALREALEMQVHQQAAVYRESQMRRKILDGLNERERMAYQQVEDRREQQRIDDLFTRRRRAADRETIG